ncbi:MAG: aldehyde dehydrogenase family protein [Chitinophagaceae bacterium]|nr:aldehyde dehydrogenase family protein [Chitinophagaceae bacterium]
MQNIPDTISQLTRIRHFFESGASKHYSFRKQQLKRLKEMVLRNEEAIFNALYADLRKSKEECYVTENGLVLSELKTALKNLKTWMKPETTCTNLINFPSFSKIYHDPLGVVLIIGAWNYPLQLLLIPLISAIAGGNCVVLKPSELAPATAKLIEKMITDSFPEEYIKVINGEGETIVPGMMNSFRFDHVFYTGSAGVGKSIYKMAAEKLIPVTLELGGKSPAIVEEDADITIAAKRIVLGKFINAGQTCIAPDYVLVHENVKENFLQALSDNIKKFWGEHPKQSADYGRIISQKRFEKICSYLNEGEIFTGGEIDSKELFIAPTILVNISADATIMHEEIFGPVLPVIPYSTTQEAVKIVKYNDNPLALYLFTRSNKIEQSWINTISFGNGCVNNVAWHFTNHYLPFGGIAQSGTGAYHGKYGFLTFTHAKPVMKTASWFDPAIKYPPLTGKLKWIKRMIG